ncbi:hypothetical protein N9D57_02010 [bacterium]|nr:hypothetical protein [bacterium]
MSFPSSDDYEFFCGFSSRRVGKIHLEFLFIHQRRMSDKKKREIFVHSRLLKLKEKGERRAKISTNFNPDLKVIIEHNFEAKKKEKDLHAKSLLLY